MLVTHFALVSKEKIAPFGELARVSSAIQKQLIRDVAPIWGVYATIDAFESLEDVPYGYYIIDVRKNIEANFEGITGEHTFPPFDGFPNAFVFYKPNLEWSLSASHECLEMLINPFGRLNIVGELPEVGFYEKKVSFSVEICDPCQHIDNAYTCNGIQVSDFITPEYFSPLSGENVRIRGSFSGKITKPRTLLPGGYQRFSVLRESSDTKKGVKEIWDWIYPKVETAKIKRGFICRYPNKNRPTNANYDFESPYFNLEKYVSDMITENAELVTQEPNKDIIENFSESKKTAEKISKRYANRFKIWFDKLISGITNR